VGFQIGARQTFSIPLQEAWKLIISPDGLREWLGNIVSAGHLEQGATYRLDNNCTGEIRVYSPLSHIRLTYQPKDWSRPSTIQVRVIPNGQKTTIAFHQENLPGANEREQRHAHFKGVLKAIKSKIDENINNA